MVLQYLSSNMIGNSNEETNSQHKLLLIDTQVLRIYKDFANASSANIKFPKTHFSRMVQLGWFLGRVLGQLLKTDLPLIRIVHKPLAKNVLITLWINSSSIRKRCSYSAEYFWIKNYIDNFKTKNWIILWK